MMQASLPRWCCPAGTGWPVSADVGPASVPRRPGFGVPGSLWLGLAGGLAWGLALMRRDRWRGIVG